MSERSESGGIVVALVAILIFILLLVTGGGAIYIIVARQQAQVIAQEKLARAADMEARKAAQAIAINQAKAQIEQAKGAVGLHPSPPGNSMNAGIEAILRAQESAWNAGNIDGFMEHYWKSDDLTFSSGGKTTRGWTDTLNRYREKYPTTEKMGQLTFGGLEIKPLGETAALVLGQWTLKRETEPLTGNFSLIVQFMDGKWVIVHDHTSRLSEE